MPEWLTRFWPDFFAGLLINFRVAAFALFLGLLLGAPLGVAEYRRQLAELPAKWLLAVLACVPTFAALFFLINVIPSNFSLGGWKIAMTPESALVIALALYATGLASEHAVEALRQTRMGSPVALWEFFLNLARVYFSLVLASGFGAAIGVAEAVNVTRRAMDALPTLSDKFMMLGMVIGAFTLLFQTLYKIENRLRNSTRKSYAPAGRRIDPI